MKILKQKDFNLEKSQISNLFLTIWIPTLIAVLITGTFVVFDGIFITHGFHEGNIFNSFNTWASPDDKLATYYASFGAVAIGYAAPFSIGIISTGAMVGGAMSYTLSKARATNDKIREQQILDSFLPICIMVGIFCMIIIIPFAKFWIWMGSGFQPIFLENWFNNPLMNSDNWVGITLEDQEFILSPGLAGHIFQQGSWYLRIQALAAIPLIYMVAVPYILREDGKPIVSIYVNFIALGGNILFDYLLIIVLGLNLVGASSATVFAEIIGMTSFMYYLRKRARTTIKTTNWKVAKDDLGKIVKNGSSYMGLQLLQMAILLSITMSIGFVFYGEPQIISYYNSAFQNYFSFYTLLNLIALGTIYSIMPIINYSYNIKNKERLRESKLLGRRVLLIFCSIATVIVLFFPIIISTMFNSTNAFLAQRISQIMILGFLMGNIILFTGLYFQSIGQIKKANLLIFTKPISVFILAITVGLILKQFPEIHLIWKRALLPWNESIANWNEITINNEPVTIQLGIFWVIPLVDIILGTISLILMNDKFLKIIKLQFAKFKKLIEKIF